MLQVNVQVPTQFHECKLMIPFTTHDNTQLQQKKGTIERSHRMNISSVIQDLIQVYELFCKTSGKLTSPHFNDLAHNPFSINNYIKLCPASYLLLYQRFCSPCRIFDWIEKSPHFPCTFSGDFYQITQSHLVLPSI